MFPFFLKTTRFPWYCVCKRRDLKLSLLSKWQVYFLNLVCETGSRPPPCHPTFAYHKIFNNLLIHWMSVPGNGLNFFCWLRSWVIRWFIYWLSACLIKWLIACMTNYLLDWLIDRLISQLADWMIDWLIVRLID